VFAYAGKWQASPDVYLGQDFLDYRSDDRCACLVLDLKIPGMGGLEAQQLISAQAAMPVIFITGRGDIRSTVSAMKGGAIDFLTKPVDEAALLPRSRRRCAAVDELEKPKHRGERFTIGRQRNYRGRQGWRHRSRA
jgi:FixJ family two-component response regulator